jgi:hypothetical protein
MVIAMPYGLCLCVRVEHLLIPGTGSLLLLSCQQ